MVSRPLLGALSLGLLLTACDRIVQHNNGGGDASVLLVDGRLEPGAGACANDVIYRADSTLYVDNLLAPAECPSEVAIFSERDAMSMHEKVTAWSDAKGDQLSVDLQPILQVPATFFLAVPNLVALAAWNAPVEQVAKEDLDETNQIYDENKTGISFGMDPRPVSLAQWLEILSLLPKALIAALAAGPDPANFACAIPKELETKGYYVPGRLNVYYVPLPGTGMMRPDDRNVVFIALDKKPATLAHEFGHTLSLLGAWGHSNGVPGIDAKNVMWVRAPDVRDHFSLGQAFRLNLDVDSILNINQIRVGPTRWCPTDFASAACPALGLDWVRP